MSTEVVAWAKEPRICHPGGEGILLPFDPKSENTTTDAQYGRAVIHIFILGWLFLGVAISSDIFMSGIEKITSQKRRVRHPMDPSRMITVQVWNDTVANLTLMAFGSSTPEILLSIIELVTNDFFTGELGANTIVGSASFNLLLIIGLCVSTISSDEVRMIKDVLVYGVTVVFSIFAYFWLYFVLQLVSPNRVDLWEAIVTFSLFPVLIGLAYLADAGYLSRGGEQHPISDINRGIEGLSVEEIAEFARGIRDKYGKELPDDKVLKLLEMELAPKKTRLSYRSGAIRHMTGRTAHAGQHRGGSICIFNIGVCIFNIGICIFNTGEEVFVYST